MEELKLICYLISFKTPQEGFTALYKATYTMKDLSANVGGLSTVIEIESNVEFRFLADTDQSITCPAEMEYVKLKAHFNSYRHR